MASPPLLIPISAVPSQQFNVTLGNQPCRLKIYTKHIQVPDQQPGQIVTNPPNFVPIDPIFIDVYVNDALVLGGALCLRNVLIVRDSYLGFPGDLSFTDALGEDDPQVSGLGSRWLLLYWPP